MVLNLDGGKSPDSVTATLTTNADSIEFKDQGWVLNIIPKPTATQKSLAPELHSCSASPVTPPPLSQSDFIIDSMGLFTKKYFAIQENLNRSTNLKWINFSQLMAYYQDNIDSGKQLIYKIHEQLSQEFMKDTVRYIFPHVSHRTEFFIYNGDDFKQIFDTANRQRAGL